MTREERKQLNYNSTHRVNSNGNEEKQCTNCKNWYEINEENFYKQPTNTSDGFSPWCIKCRKEYQNKYRKENIETHHTRDKIWRKNNKEHVSKCNKIYYEQNTEKFYKKLKKWQSENLDKIKDYNNKKQHHKISKIEWQKCKEYFNNCCAYCGLNIEEHFITYRGKLKLTDLHKEHVDDKGSNDLSNCVPACKRCNSLKGSYEFTTWYSEDNKIFNKERLDKIYKWLNEDYKNFI